MTETRKGYLGDGLYVDFDGEKFRLHTERDTGTHEVFLDDTVLVAFLRFVAGIREGAPLDPAAPDQWTEL